MSLNRWVLKKVAFESENVFAQSNVSRTEVESSRWMEQQQKKRDGPVRCVREERRASEERRARGGARVCTSSLRYVGVAVVRTL